MCSGRGGDEKRNFVLSSCTLLIPEIRHENRKSGATGGMAPDAVKLLEAMVEASQEQLTLWDGDSTLMHLHSLVAVAIQLDTAAFACGVEGRARRRASR